jgi:hypothetical protein
MGVLVGEGVFVGRAVSVTVGGMAVGVAVGAGGEAVIVGVSLSGTGVALADAMDSDDEGVVGSGVCVGDSRVPQAVTNQSTISSTYALFAT